MIMVKGWEKEDSRSRTIDDTLESEELQEDICQTEDEAIYREARPVDIQTAFFRDIGPTKRLTREEEQEQIAQIRAGGKQTKDEFVQNNIPLIVSIAKKIWYSPLTLLDKVQEGAIGLMEAVDKYDPAFRTKKNPDKPIKFSTYATWWIKQKIHRAIQTTGSTIRIPAYLAEKSLEELSEEEQELVRKARNICSFAHANKRFGNDCFDGTQYIADKRARKPEEELEKRELQKLVAKALKELPRDEAEVVFMRNYECLSYIQIARQLGTTPEKVKATENQALNRLRKKLGNNESLKQEYQSKPEDGRKRVIELLIPTQERLYELCKEIEDSRKSGRGAAQIIDWYEKNKPREDVLQKAHERRFERDKAKLRKAGIEIKYRQVTNGGYYELQGTLEETLAKLDAYFTRHERIFLEQLEELGYLNGGIVCIPLRILRQMPGFKYQTNLKTEFLQGEKVAIINADKIGEALLVSRELAVDETQELALERRQAAYLASRGISRWAAAEFVELLKKAVYNGNGHLDAPIELGKNKYVPAGLRGAINKGLLQIIYDPETEKSTVEIPKEHVISLDTTGLEMVREANLVYQKAVEHYFARQKIGEQNKEPLCQLLEEGVRTIGELARALDCKPSTALIRIQQLRSKGVNIQSRRGREGGYYIETNAAEASAEPIDDEKLELYRQQYQALNRLAVLCNGNGIVEETAGIVKMIEEEQKRRKETLSTYK